MCVFTCRVCRFLVFLAALLSLWLSGKMLLGLAIYTAGLFLLSTHLPELYEKLIADSYSAYQEQPKGIRHDYKPLIWEDVTIIWEVCTFNREI